MYRFCIAVQMEIAGSSSKLELLKALLQLLPHHLKLSRSTAPIGPYHSKARESNNGHLDALMAEALGGEGSAEAVAVEGAVPGLAVDLPRNRVRFASNHSKMKGSSVATPDR
ncbi:MAG: hypothetical protein ACK56I_17850, partial [bacterium]